MYNPEEYKKGRGAQLNVKNPFEKRSYSLEEINEFFEPLESDSKTEYFTEYPRKIVNKVDSPDVGAMFSMNPYQGCEHGCIYCYARNSHQYWGFSAGLDFERKIMIKENAAELLRKTFDSKKWSPEPIMLSGNTDCYQPIERKKKITRSLLETCLEYRNPVGVITKNSLIIRDIDLLSELAKLRLLHVSVSITSLNEDLRIKMEPRTTTAKQRLKIIELLSAKGIPMNVMVAPIVPSLNDHEIPDIIKAAADSGAVSAGFTIVRLNGSIGKIFTDWVYKTFPDRAEKVLRHIGSVHGGTLNDSRWGTRMHGEGKISESIKQLFRISCQRFLAGKFMPDYDLSIFSRPQKGQLSLF